MNTDQFRPVYHPFLGSDFDRYSAYNESGEQSTGSTLSLWLANENYPLAYLSVSPYVYLNISFPVTEVEPVSVLQMSSTPVLPLWLLPSLQFLHGSTAVTRWRIPYISAVALRSLLSRFLSFAPSSGRLSRHSDLRRQIHRERLIDL